MTRTFRPEQSSPLESRLSVPDRVVAEDVQTQPVPEFGTRELTFKSTGRSGVADSI